MNGGGAFTVSPQMNNTGFSFINRGIPKDACVSIVTKIKDQFPVIRVNDVKIVNKTRYDTLLDFNMDTLISSCTDNSMMQLSQY